MSQIINLRTRRKQAARDAARAEGTANAGRHGQSKAQTALHKARADKAERDLDAHLRDTGPQDPSR